MPAWRFGPDRGKVYGAEPGCEGATAVEYALMAALIGLVVVGSVMAVGVATNASFADLLALLP